MKAQIIEIEGQFYKECEVVMLEARSSTISGHSNHLDWYKIPVLSNAVFKARHLYITSDDEIKEGDWILTEAGIICQVLKLGDVDGDKKIIATTDTSLHIQLENQCDGCKAGLPLDGNIHKDNQIMGIRCSKDRYVESLPQPSDKFIEAYIKAYNKGEKIEKVLVEYDKFFHTRGYLALMASEDWRNNPVNHIYELKLKDGNIIIKKIKDSWTREEVIKLIQSFHICTDGTKEYETKWIEENL